ncbi:MAG TPA: hypothetical protein VLF09_03105 [Cellvibrio sp.]|nr:hypothetical protein [Cellvibrio sp.]
MDISLVVAAAVFSGSAIFFTWRYEVRRRQKLQLRKTQGDGVCPVGFWVSKGVGLPANQFLLGFRNDGGILWFEVNANILSDMGVSAKTLLEMSASDSLYHLSPVGIIATELSRKEFLQQYGKQRPEKNS